MPSPAVVTSLVDDINVMDELDNMDSQATPGGAVRSATRTRRVRLERPPAIPTRIEMPLQPEAPARLETLVQPERPVEPARPGDPERRVKRAKPIRLEVPPAPGHVDEIGKGVEAREAREHAGSASRLQRVPASLAVLTIVLCFSTGAGSAALVFGGRVAQITATWAK